MIGFLCIVCGVCGAFLLPDAIHVVCQAVAALANIGSRDEH